MNYEKEMNQYSCTAYKLLKRHLMSERTRHIVELAKLLYYTIKRVAWIGMRNKKCARATKQLIDYDPTVTIMYAWVIDGIAKANTENSPGACPAFCGTGKIYINQNLKTITSN